MKDLNLVQKAIVVWYLISLFLVGSAFDASVEGIIALSVNFAASAICLDKLVINYRKENKTK